MTQLVVVSAALLLSACVISAPDTDAGAALDGGTVDLEGVCPVRYPDCLCPSGLSCHRGFTGEYLCVPCEQPR